MGTPSYILNRPNSSSPCTQGEDTGGGDRLTRKMSLKFEISNFKSLISCLLLLLSLPALAQSAPRHDLSGKSADAPILWEFFPNQGKNAGQWTRIPVPSCLENLDFSKSSFGAAPASKDLPASGLYRLGFRPPESFLNKRVFIVFDGAMTDLSVRLNGEPLGQPHQGGFTPFRYEITELLKFNQENLLDAHLAANSSDPTVNLAERTGAYHLFSGIHRPVYLIAYPKEFISQAAINAQASGDLSLNITIDGLTSADSVKAQILDGNRPVGQPFTAPLTPESPAATLSTQLPSPKLWSPDSPTLYSLQITLLSGNQPIHVLTQKFGFRTVELRKGAGLFINGARVLLKGISHDPYSEKFARSTSTDSRADVALIKTLNANAISLAHFPANDDFLDACDQLGLFVVDVLPGIGQNVYSPEIAPKIASELLARDQNHPSVILFSTPNADTDEFFAANDIQKRPVIHPDVIRPSWEKLTQLTKAEDPFICLDALPAPTSDSIAAGLSDAWSLLSKSPSAAGLFIRAIPDETADSSPKPLSPVPAISQLWNPILIQPTTLPFKGDLTLVNQSDFSNLKDYKASWITVSYPKPGDKKSALSLAQGKLELPSAAPGQSAQATLKWLADPAADAVKLTLKDPNDTELQTLVFPLRPKGYYVSAIEKSTLNSLVTLDEEADAWMLSGLAGSIRVDKQTARLKSASYANKSIAFSAGPSAGDSRLASLSKITEDDAKGLLATFSEGELRSVQWLLLPSGWFKLSYALQTQGPHNTLGVTFKLDNLKTLSFVGDGPAPLFKNRLAGNTLGQWNLDNFSGNLSNVRFARLTTDTGTLHLVIDDPALFLHLSSNELGILHAIPPAPGAIPDYPSTLPTDANGAYHGTIYFKFGE